MAVQLVKKSKVYLQFNNKSSDSAEQIIQSLKEIATSMDRKKKKIG